MTPPVRGPQDRQGLLLRVAIALIALVVIAEAFVLLARERDDAGSADLADVRSRVPEPPLDAFSTGSYVESRITAEGKVRVKQWVQSREPLSRLNLELPALPTQARSARATNLLLAADRVVVDRTGTVDTTGRLVTFDSPASVVYLRYTLEGVVQRTPSARRRALAWALALDVRPLTGPSRLVLVDDDVLSVACARRQGAAPRRCGAPTTEGWRVRLRGPRRSSLVQAQVQLG